MGDAVWILGATGGTGRAIATRLDAAGAPLVLVGRDAARLEEVTRTLGSAPRTVVGSLDALPALFRAAPPAVVVNTVGPFVTTAGPIIAALPAGTHYVDIANEYRAFEAVLAMHESASAQGSVLVTGAGFGVVSTESIVLRLCQGQPPALSVRVDALPSLALTNTTIGSALAGTIVESMPFGRRQIRDGRLVKASLDQTPAVVRTPDGDELQTANFPSGDLLAAWRASRAETVVSASSEVPYGSAIGIGLPVMGLMARSRYLRRVATARLSRVKVTARERPRAHSWGHAHVAWASGTSAEGWFRAEDALDFTTAVAAEVTLRLAAGEGRPGAHTPGSLFGASLAEAAGAELITEPNPRPTNDHGARSTRI
jgi:short subunit dehydrogenase-like uncharacterized protein